MSFDGDRINVRIAGLSLGVGSIGDDAMNHWWRESRDAGKCCVLYGYAVGKSQRLLAGLRPRDRTNLHARCGRKGKRSVPGKRRESAADDLRRRDQGKHDWRGAMVRRGTKCTRDAMDKASSVASARRWRADGWRFAAHVDDAASIADL